MQPGTADSQQAAGWYVRKTGAGRLTGQALKNKQNTFYGPAFEMPIETPIAGRYESSPAAGASRLADLGC